MSTPPWETDSIETFFPIADMGPSISLNVGFKPAPRLNLARNGAGCPTCDTTYHVSEGKIWLNGRTIVSCPYCYPKGVVEPAPITEEQRMKALASYLDVKLIYIDTLGCQEFRVEDGDDGEYTVLTEEEADERVLEQLIDDFPDVNHDLVSKLDEHGVEDFFDVKSWAEWVLRSDGRATTLAAYDGEEHYHSGFYICRIN